MSLFNVFSDPVIAAQQDQLNGTWASLWAAYQACDSTPDSAFSEFATDKAAWDSFYASGSDWSASSKNATNDWQRKAQDWSVKLTGWGCNGNSNNAAQTGASGIPGVKDPPPDAPGLLDDLKHAATSPLASLESYIRTAGWVAVGLVVLVIGSVVYIATRGKVSGYGVKVG